MRKVQELLHLGSQLTY